MSETTARGHGAVGVPAETKENSTLTRYTRWLGETRGLACSPGDYDALWRWSTDRLEDFRGSLWEYFDIQASTPYQAVLHDRAMPGARWFPDATFNYAEHVFRHVSKEPDKPAVLFASETHELGSIGWRELHDRVRAVAAGLRGLNL